VGSPVGDNVGKAVLHFCLLACSSTKEPDFFSESGSTFIQRLFDSADTHEARLQFSLLLNWKSSSFLQSNIGATLMTVVVDKDRRNDLFPPLGWISMEERNCHQQRKIWNYICGVLALL
jgi:hypothetical protein